MTDISTKLGFIFPGQGSQSLGMLSELANEFPIIHQTFTEASTIIGEDLWEISQNGPESRLNETVVTQPAMLAGGVAVWRVWQSITRAVPALMAGHSLGEYTALVCSGKLDYIDAVTVVKQRSEAMQAAVPAGQGAMAAILGLDDDAVRQACDAGSKSGVVEPVNFNAPGQVVIAGEQQAVSHAVENAKQAGAKRAVLLPVSVPSHCELMRPAAEQLSAVIDATELQQSAVNIVQNVDARIHHNSTDIRENLKQQLYRPVLWVDTIHAMNQHGVSQFVECGPGKVLSGLLKRIIKGVESVSVNTTDSLATARLFVENQ
ncbi:MAG: ACP S-malonyltransferase [Gammaproteobacteria bacterium]|nr:ACP S-malonyltransferase [Gammaproteobacteria bacterium]